MKCYTESWIRVRLKHKEDSKRLEPTVAYHLEVAITNNPKLLNDIQSLVSFIAEFTDEVVTFSELEEDTKES